MSDTPQPERRRGPAQSLFGKICFFAALVSVLPLLVAAWLSLRTATGVAQDLVRQNLAQLAAQVAERVSYTLVSIEADLEILAGLPPGKEALKTFALSQRRELFTETGGSRTRVDVPKYREVALYSSDGAPLLTVVDDVVIADTIPFRPHKNRWCEADDFIAAAVAAAGKPVVTPLVGCHYSVSRYKPGEGRLGPHFDGGVRVSKAVATTGGEGHSVATLVLSELHLAWALQAVSEIAGNETWALMMDREGWVLSHPSEPSMVRGPDRDGTPRTADGFGESGALRLPSAPAPAGPGFENLLARGNANATSSARIQAEGFGDWVAASSPVAVELGPYGPKSPFATVVVLTPHDKVAAVSRELRTSIGLLLLVTLIAALMGSLLLARNLSRPISELAQATAKVARGEVFSLSTQRKDELGDLARAFLQMQLDLDLHKESLRRSERLAAVGGFASGIVHETKNLIAGLGSYLSVLERKVPKELADTLIASMRKTLGEVDALTVRLRGLSAEPTLGPTDLGAVLRESIDQVQAKARERAVALDIGLPGSLHLPRADGGLLVQAFSNLLHNAIEACEGEGRVRIRAEASGDDVLVTIRDTGRGLPAAGASAVVEPFVTTKEGGTGLGLFIVRTVVERHGGRLRLREHDMGGVVATVRLPA